MTAEQRLLDVIAKTRIGSVTIAPEMAARILAALREAIAEDPELLSEFIPQGGCVYNDTSELHRLMKLGRAVEARKQASGGVVNAGWDEGWNACLDAIYTTAGIERQP